MHDILALLHLVYIWWWINLDSLLKTVSLPMCLNRVHFQLELINELGRLILIVHCFYYNFDYRMQCHCGLLYLDAMDLFL